MNFELRHLEAFVAVARHGSFTRAARSLNVSQPAFTVQIRQLEAGLGLRLLDRTTRSVELTQAGRELAPALERSLRELSALLASTAALPAKASGHVSVAALPSLCGRMLPTIIAAFLRKHRGIRVHLCDALGVRIPEMVKCGEVDFGLGSVQKSDPDIEFTGLFRDRMHAIFPRDNAMEKKKSVTLQELTAFPLILMSRDSTVRAVVDRAMESIGNFGTPAYEAAYMSTALGMVRAGLGVTILPSSAVDAETGKDLVSIPVVSPSLNREIGFIQKRGRSLSPAADALIEAIRTSRRRNAR
jgi:LysR family carnitine catabolism transcriptional activator